MGRGRPRSTNGQASSVAVATPTQEVREGDKPNSEPMPELKECPACGGPAHAWQDKNKLWRCSCKGCGFWDSIVKYTEIEARKSYNASGGPNKNPVVD